MLNKIQNYKFYTLMLFVLFSFLAPYTIQADTNGYVGDLSNQNGAVFHASERLNADQLFSIQSGSSSPAINSPSPNSTLTGSAETFTWTANGSQVLEWWVFVGDALGKNNYFNSGSLGERSRSITIYSLPTDDSILFVRLWYRTDIGWQSTDLQYTAADPSTAPEIVNPVANSILGDDTQTFEWTANGVSILQWQLYIGDSVGSSNFYRSASLLGDSLSTTVSELPKDSRTLYVRLWYLNSDYQWQSKDYEYIAASGAMLPTINAPVPDSALTGSVETFTWTPNGTRALRWILYVGDALGANNLYRSNNLPSSTRSATVYNLPTDDSTLYVRLLYETDAGWQSVDAQYTAADPSTAPAIVSPVANSILADGAQTFEWTANGVNVLKWQLYIGDSVGSSNIYRGKHLPGSTLTTTVSELPRDSRTLYVRLWYLNEEYKWQSKDFEYTSASGATLPAITSPLPNSTLVNGSVETCTWTKNGTHVLGWMLWVGDTLGAKNLFESGSLRSSKQSVTVYNLPTDDSILYVRLWYQTDAGWQSIDVQYTAADPSTAPAIISPDEGSVLFDGTETFEWTANGVNVLQWVLYIGDSVGSSNIYREGLPGSTLSTTVSELPRDNRTLYVRLWYLNDDYQWESKDFEYTAASGATLPAITSPSLNSTLTGSVETFTWAKNGTHVLGWMLWVGDTLGAKNLFESRSLRSNTRSVDVYNLPTDDSALFVRLWYQTDSGWQFIDTQYTAANPSTAPSIINPVANSILADGTQTFEWTANGVNVLQWVLYIGDSVGSSNIYREGLLGSTLSTAVSELPQDSDTLYVRLWYLNEEYKWLWKDYEYIAATGAMLPTIIDPVPDSTLAGTSETFTWDANGTRVLEWWLYIGDSAGENNLYDSRSLSSGTRSATVYNLPPNNTLTYSSPLYVRLWYRTDVDWQFTDVQYSAASSSTVPEITNPVANSVLTGDTQTFDWTTNGVNNILYWTVWIGDSIGSNNFYSSGILPSSSVSTVANGLPTDGSSLHARLWYSNDGFKWQWRDFEYTAVSGAMGP